MMASLEKLIKYTDEMNISSSPDYISDDVRKKITVSGTKYNVRDESFLLEVIYF